MQMTETDARRLVNASKIVDVRRSTFLDRNKSLLHCTQLLKVEELGVSSRDNPKLRIGSKTLGMGGSDQAVTDVTAKSNKKEGDIHRSSVESSSSNDDCVNNLPVGAAPQVKTVSQPSMGDSAPQEGSKTQLDASSNTKSDSDSNSSCATTVSSQEQRDGASPTRLDTSSPSQASESSSPAAKESPTDSSSSKQRKKDRTKWRKGKWTVEEEEFTSRIIQHFSNGLLALPEGATLRSFLSEKLNCDPMRITKKFTGACCLGRRVYHLRDRTRPPLAEVEMAKVELDHLEARFRLRVEHEQSGLPLSLRQEMLLAQPNIATSIYPSSTRTPAPLSVPAATPWLQHLRNSAMAAGPLAASPLAANPVVAASLQTAATLQTATSLQSAVNLPGLSPANLLVGQPQAKSPFAAVARSPTDAQPIATTNLAMGGNTVQTLQLAMINAWAQQAAQSLAPALAQLGFQAGAAVAPVQNQLLQQTSIPQTGQGVPQRQLQTPLGGKETKEQRQLRMAYEQRLNQVTKGESQKEAEDAVKAAALPVPMQNPQISPAELLKKNYEEHLKSLHGVCSQTAASPKGAEAAKQGTNAGVAAGPEVAPTQANAHVDPGVPRQTTSEADGKDSFLGFINSVQALKKSFQDAVAKNTPPDPSEKSASPQAAVASKLSTETEDSKPSSKPIAPQGDGTLKSSSTTTQTNQKVEPPHPVTDSSILSRSDAGSGGSSSQPTESSSSMEDSDSKSDKSTSEEKSDKSSTDDKTDPSSSEEEKETSKVKKGPLRKRNTSKNQGAPRKRMKASKPVNPFTTHNVLEHSRLLSKEFDERKGGFK